MLVVFYIRCSAFVLLRRKKGFTCCLMGFLSESLFDHPAAGYATANGGEDPLSFAAAAWAEC